MNRTPTDEELELLASVRDDWIAYGLSTQPADRKKAELSLLAAYQVIFPERWNQLVIWVDSPMAGVIASAYLGFAFGEPMKPRLTEPVDVAVAVNSPAAQQIRRDVDDTVWRIRNAVHAQVAADLSTKVNDPQWQRQKYELGNYAWACVYNAIGDPGYTYYGFEDNARESEDLFEENLTPWADAMMEGQFSAGKMAQLDALNLLTGLDLAPFQGLQRIAQNCSWWWAYDSCTVVSERPITMSVDGDRVTMEFRDGWRVG